VSQFVGAALYVNIVQANNLTGAESRIRTAWGNHGFLELNPWSKEIEGEFRNLYWPGRGGLIGDSGAGETGLGLPFGDAYSAGGFEPPEYTSGTRIRYVITGKSRDGNGSPMGTCIVKLFRTADDSLQDSTTSDGSGNFRVTTPWYEVHYLNMYKAGSPDIYGTTPNTIYPNG
jgi:hypothetical protein